MATVTCLRHSPSHSRDGLEVVRDKDNRHAVLEVMHSPDAFSWKLTPTLRTSSMISVDRVEAIENPAAFMPDEYRLTGVSMKC